MASGRKLSSETKGLLAGTMRYFWVKVYFKSWRAPGNLFLPNQFQNWSNSVLLIGQKNIFSAQSAMRSSRVTLSPSYTKKVTEASKIPQQLLYGSPESLNRDEKFREMFSMEFTYTRVTHCAFIALQNFHSDHYLKHFCEFPNNISFTFLLQKTNPHSLQQSS